jgi:hypothetical protein
MKLFESLKRLLEPRARPPVETIGEATADRPPPREVAPVEQPVVIEEPVALEAVVEEPVVEEPVAPEFVAAVDDASDVSEVRELLEAVADSPVVEPETQGEVPPPAAPPTSPESAVVPSAPTARVGDALVLTLGNPAATFTVAKATVTLGRGEENKIRLDDLSVSRRHARIAWKQGGYWLSDLGSMGGTWVDGTRLIAPHRIAAGEVIDIGLCRLTVSSAGGAEKAEAKKSSGRTRSELADSRRPR